MDHQEALRLQAAEKYILGELTADLREQFEEHYFDCPECATDLRALGTFLTAGRQVLREAEVFSHVPSPPAKAERPGWFRWLRPVIAVPAIAILAAIVVFQNVVTIPSARRRTGAENLAQVYESSYRLAGATRSGVGRTVTVRADRNFALELDFTPSQAFPSYNGKLVDSSGASVLTFGLGGEQVNKELHLVIPAGKVHSGNYDLVVTGSSGNSDRDLKAREVLRIPFVVASEP